MRDDLEVFTPIPRVLTIAGKTVSILPLRLRNYARFVRAIGGPLPQLMTGDQMGALVDHTDNLCEAVAIGSGLTIDEVGDLHVDEFVELSTAVFEVNADFFTRRVLPLIDAGKARLAAIVDRPDGVSSSPGLAPEDTPSTPAST